MGFRRFSFRGLKKVEAEWTLVCLALERGHLRPLDRRRNRGRNSPAANGAFEPTRTPSPARQVPLQGRLLRCANWMR